MVRLPMGRLCQAGTPHQLRLVQRMATDSPMLAQPRRPLNLLGMGLMTLRHMSDCGVGRLEQREAQFSLHIRVILQHSEPMREMHEREYGA